MITGENDILRTKAIKYEYMIDTIRRVDLFSRNMWYDVYEDNLQNAVMDFNQKTQFTTFYLMANSGIY